MTRDDTASGPSLAALQRALFGALRGDGAAQAFPDDGEALLESAIVGDDKASAATRITLYATMYRVRLIDSLAEDFPKLEAVLGSDDFRALASDYLRAHPSESPSLRHLGRHLPAFVRTQPIGQANPWLAELAQLEWARVDVFDLADEPLATRESLATHAESGFATLTLALIEARRVLQVTYPVESLWRALERGESPEIAPSEPAPGALLVWRRPDQHVYHRRLDALEAACLAQLARGPVSFSALCARAAEMLAPADAARRMAGLLATWLDGGLLRAAHEANLDAVEPTI